MADPRKCRPKAAGAWHREERGTQLMSAETIASGVSRRAMLKTVAVASAGAALPCFAFGATAVKSDPWSSLMAYLESLSRPDGGYAWADQEQSHLTPTFAVIGCYQVLKATP